MTNYVYGDHTDETFNEKDGISGDVDWVYAGGGSDWVYGLGGNDYLFGQNGDDHLFGGLGNDYLQGGAGFDELDGGDGDEDTASYTDSWEGVAVTLTSGVGWGFGGTAEGDTLVGIEIVHGSLFGDYLSGNADDNILLGFSGQDTLKGGGGADHLQGNAGNDILNGGGGADEIWGGNHGQFGRDESDTVSYASSPSWVLVSLRDNYAYNGDAAGDRLYSIENLTGSAHTDSLAGDDFANVLRGMGGDDTLHGHGDNDTLIGDEGIDWLVGGAGADTMIGGLGDDVYFVDDIGDRITESAGQGDDTVRASTDFVLPSTSADIENLRTTDNAGFSAINLTGNASNNGILGNNGVNVLTGGGGRDELTGYGGPDSFRFATPVVDPITMVVDPLDTIMDFNVADDTIELAGMWFGFALGPLAEARFVVGTAAADRNDNIIYNSITGDLFYDSDGSDMAAMPIQFATLTGAPALTYADFVVV